MTLSLSLSLSLQCFEGLKAYHGVDGKIRLFRPMENMKRMNNSAVIASLPVRMEGERERERERERGLSEGEIKQ